MTTVKTLIFLLLLLSTPLTRAELVLHWESDFDLTEKQKLTLWVRNAHQAVENLVRPFPFSIDIHFHRAHSSYKPTRWANTIRSRRQGIRFYIDPSYSQQALLDDWVAYHEFSHLLIPYLGLDNTWFAEGFASFMQFQVMASSSVLTTAEKARAYQTRIDKARRKFDLDHLPFVDAAATLRSRRDYPTMYWGGAVYFLNVDRSLKQRGRSVIDTLQAYAECCRKHSADLPSLVQELDRLSNGRSFELELIRMQEKPGFPDTSADRGCRAPGTRHSARRHDHR